MLRIASASTARRLSGFAAVSAGTIAYTKSSPYDLNWNGKSNWNMKMTSCSSTKLSENASIVHNDTQEQQDMVQQIRPIIQASTRALRLVSTVAMIIYEYKLDQYQHWINTTMENVGFEKYSYLMTNSNKQDRLRQQLEQDVQNKLCDLQEAQRRYAEPNENDQHEHEHDNNVNNIDNAIHKKERLESNRKAVHEAAETLGDAEHQLTEFMKTNNSSSESISNTTGTTKKTNSNTSTSVHAKAATRLKNLCRINGGTYIKIGQHIANLDHLLPPDYISILHSLFSECPETPYDHVREVIYEELGDYPEQLFDDFDIKPIASASLAQVHIAKEKGTGRKLAIKVQHRGLRETSRGDLIALEYVVRLVDNLFDEFKWGWIVDEIAPNLPKELDFKHEGRNAEKAAKHLAKTGLNCIVPKVHWNHTTSRILCMDYEEGHSVTDITHIEKDNVNKRELAILISSVFQAQIFDNGFIHCDPHPANVLFRKTKNGGNGKSQQLQLVLLDHGLYKQIDDDFRINYATLWKALLMADIDQIKVSCNNLGINEMYPLLSAMLMSRPFDEVIERSKTKSFTAKSQIDANADKAMIRGYAQQYIGEIIKLLDKVPRQMLLLFKMNDCLRHIDHALGSNANTLIIAGKYAAKAVYRNGGGSSFVSNGDGCMKTDSATSTTSCTVNSPKYTFMQNLRNWFSFVVVISRIKIYEMVEWWAHEQKLIL